MRLLPYLTLFNLFIYSVRGRLHAPPAGTKRMSRSISFAPLPGNEQSKHLVEPIKNSLINSLPAFARCGYYGHCVIPEDLCWAAFFVVRKAMSDPNYFTKFFNMDEFHVYFYVENDHVFRFPGPPRGWIGKGPKGENIGSMDFYKNGDSIKGCMSFPSAKITEPFSNNSNWSVFNRLFSLPLEKFCMTSDHIDKVDFYLYVPMNLKVFGCFLPKAIHLPSFDLKIPIPPIRYQLADQESGIRSISQTMVDLFITKANEFT